MLLAGFLASALLYSSPQGPTAAAPPESPSRLDVPLTLAVATPHVAWGKPSPGAPVRAFVVPSVSEGRTLVELAQRIDLVFDTVMIDEAWDVNTWTVGTDQDYESRNYRLLYKYLEADLSKPTSYDVIVLPSLHGWNRLPTGVREAIRRRVEGGTGLVLIHPTTGVPAPDDPPTQRPMNDFAPDYEVPTGDELWEISPLVGALSDRLTARGHREIRQDAVASGAWRRVAQHFITDNVPLESFPDGFLKHYRYHASEGSTVLVEGPQGEPIVATKTLGKGRVVALGYLNTGLSPMIDWKIRGTQSDRWWEYFYSLLGRSILWAAQREPALTLGPMSVVEKAMGKREVVVPIQSAGGPAEAALMAKRWNEWGVAEGTFGQSLGLKPGVNQANLEVTARPSSAGRHYIDLILSAAGKHYDWGTVSFDIPKPDEIISLATDREFYSRGDDIQVSFETRAGNPGKFVAELLDNRGRLIGRQQSGASSLRAGEGRAVLEVGNYTTNIGWARLTLLAEEAGKPVVSDRKAVRVNFTGLDRGFGAYELIMPWYGPRSYQPWTPTLDAQFRKIGVTVVEDPGRNFRLISEVHAPGFGVYWHYRQKYLEQKARFLETGDKRYLIREPDLADDAWLDELRRAVRRGMEDAGYQYDFLTTEQIEAGKLAGYRVLILPDSIALSDGEVTAMRAFVERGGLLLSDVETGLMNSHGRWQAAGRLDDVLGVQRLQVRSAPDEAQKTKLRVALSRSVVEMEVLAGGTLRTTTGRPGAAAGDTVFLVENRYGAGRSVALNFWMGDYEELRRAGGQEARLELLRDLLASAAVRPVAEVRKAGGDYLACSEVVRFRKGTSQYLAVLPEPNCRDAGRVTISLAAPAHVYDLRAHRYLGRLTRVSGLLVAGEPLLYGLLPRPVARLSIPAPGGSAGPPRVKPGDTVSFTIRLTGRAGEELPDSAVHVEVRDPAGKVLDYYGANLPLAQGAGEFAVRLALDDKPGRWRVVAREPFNHQTASATFTVQP